ncbi:MAG: hypothetical protein K8I30_12890 [Anaerolineae bacterium]|nr:hypothetical protein [Anaerolineae bacterium]
MLPNIFDRFYRAEGADAAHGGGTGLGPAIVKTIVEIHDGSVEVVSMVGKGSTFHVRLPLAGIRSNRHSGGNRICLIPIC